MLTRVSIRGFKALREVSTTLPPLTVFVGPNGSGKSSFLQALGLLSSLSRMSMQASFGTSRFQDLIHGDLTDVEWEVDGSADQVGSFSWSLSFPRVQERLVSARATFVTKPGEPSFVVEGPTKERVATGSGRTGLYQVATTSLLPNVEPIVRAVACQYFALAPVELRRGSAETSTRLASTGANLAGVLRAMRLGAPRSAVAVDEALRREFPGISEVCLFDQGREFFGYRIAGRPDAVPVEHVSDGTLLYTAYLALAHGETDDVLLVEEPENYIHPVLLSRVMDLLRGIAEGRYGRRRQVIMTTHSPLVLNAVRPSEIRAMLRTADGVRVATPTLTEEELVSLGMGDAWVFLGEERMTRAQADDVPSASPAAPAEGD